MVFIHLKSTADPGDHLRLQYYVHVTISNPSINWLKNCLIWRWLPIEDYRRISERIWVQCLSFHALKPIQVLNSGLKRDLDPQLAICVLQVWLRHLAILTLPWTNGQETLVCITSATIFFCIISATIFYYILCVNSPIVLAYPSDILACGCWCTWASRTPMSDLSAPVRSAPGSGPRDTIWEPELNLEGELYFALGIMTDGEMVIVPGRDLLPSTLRALATDCGRLCWPGRPFRPTEGGWEKEIQIKKAMLWLKNCNSNV